MIEVSDLTRRYGKNRGIDNVSFTIPEGGIVGLLGPNGAGKTTTMNIISGYLAPNSGTVRVAGFDVLENPNEAKRHIGYLPEHPPLYLQMTVNEYLFHVYELKGLRRSDRRRHVNDICEKTGLCGVSGRVTGNLSKGYRQRVGLAQAMLGDPEILILDEPTIGLDPRQIVEIRNVIREIGRRRTVILSTHILTEAASLCERVLLISNGRIVADDMPEKLADAAKGSAIVLRSEGDREDLLSLLSRLDGVESFQPMPEAEPGSYDFLIEPMPGTDVRRQLSAMMAEAGYPILLLSPKKSSLEDIFLKLTDEGSPEDEKKGGG